MFDASIRAVRGDTKKQKVEETWPGAKEILASIGGINQPNQLKTEI